MVKQKQRGVILVFLVIVIAVLLGVAAFSLDMGRLFVLKTELQNAADAAALAAAKELNSTPGTILRAKTAAVSLIREESFFAKVKSALSPDLVEGEDISFRFFCAIENDLDEHGEFTGDCGDNTLSDGKVEVLAESTDADVYVHYVEVTLNPRETTTDASDRYKIPLYFLPALRAIGINAPTEAATSAHALAGRQYRPCRYPPMMICDPAEDSSLPPLDVGDMIVLKEMTGPNSTWAPGSFGFLVPVNCLGPDGKSTCNGNEYKTEFENQLANESEIGCSPPYVSTDPGNFIPIEPINSRFGIGSTMNRPAAPNVIDYPRDDNFLFGRYGDGNMLDPVYDPTAPLPSTLDELMQLSETQYRNYYFTSPIPAAQSKPTRYEHYLSEIGSGVLPSFTTSYVQDCQDVYESFPNNTNKLKDCRNLKGAPKTSHVGDENRRVLYVASLNCKSQNIKGNVNKIYVPPPPAGWKRFFLTEHVEPPPSGDKVSYYAEYLGPVSESDGNFDVIIQLYE